MLKLNTLLRYSPTFFLPILVASAAQIHILSWSTIVKLKQYSAIAVADHYGDIASHLVNCFFIIRVTQTHRRRYQGKTSSVLHERAVFLVQTGVSLYILLHPASAVYSSLVDAVLRSLLLLQQVACWVVAFVYLAPTPKGSNLNIRLTQANDTLMPIAMVYSFLLTNFRFPWLPSENMSSSSSSLLLPLLTEWLVVVYTVASSCAKFYCIYIYVLCQLQSEVDENPLPRIEEKKALICSSSTAAATATRSSIQNGMLLAVSVLLIIADCVYVVLSCPVSS